MTEKQFKIILRKDREPELYQWATTLAYGVFPKVILENLAWMHNKGLLVRGSLVLPDILIEHSRNDSNLNQHNQDYAAELSRLGIDIKEILGKTNEILSLISDHSISNIPITDHVAKNTISEPTHIESHQSQPIAPVESEPTLEPESTHATASLDESNTYENEVEVAIPSPFKIFKKKESP